MNLIKTHLIFHQISQIKLKEREVWMSISKFHGRNYSQTYIYKCTVLGLHDFLESYVKYKQTHLYMHFLGTQSLSIHLIRFSGQRQPPPTPKVHNHWLKPILSFSPSLFLLVIHSLPSCDMTELWGPYPLFFRSFQNALEMKNQRKWGKWN